MSTTLLVHITAGGLGILTGFVALYAAKGKRLHRKSGLLFVYAMLVMASTGALIAALRGAETSVIGGLLAGYLVITALATVRPPSAGSRSAGPTRASWTRWPTGRRTAGSSPSHPRSRGHPSRN